MVDDRPAIPEGRVADAQRLGQAELADVVDELPPAFAVGVDDRQLGAGPERLAHA